MKPKHEKNDKNANKTTTDKDSVSTKLTNASRNWSWTSSNTTLCCSSVVWLRSAKCCIPSTF